MQEDRIRHAGLRDRVVDADHAAALIQPGEPGFAHDSQRQFVSQADRLAGLQPGFP